MINSNKIIKYNNPQLGPQFADDCTSRVVTGRDVGNSQVMLVTAAGSGTCKPISGLLPGDNAPCIGPGMEPAPPSPVTVTSNHEFCLLCTGSRQPWALGGDGGGGRGSGSIN